MVVERGALIEQVVGADDGGVAAGVAAADPAFFEHCDVGEAVLAREVVGRSQPVTAAADDEGVIGGLGLGTAPLRRPAALAGQAPYQQRQAGEGLHRRVLLGCDASARASCSRRSCGDEHPRAYRLERARHGALTACRGAYGAVGATAAPLMAVRGFTWRTNSAT